VEGVYTADVTIDNGTFGTVSIRFETGRLAKLAGGSSVVYMDDQTRRAGSPARSSGAKAGRLRTRSSPAG
jgi:polyribonucleotide nucleotidyltransferase